MLMRRFAAAGVLCIAAGVSLEAQDWDDDWRRRSREGVQIRIGRDYYLPPDHTISRPLVVVGGDATLDGRVDDDVMVVGGTLTIGPSANVRAEVVALGGDIHIADTAQISGEVRDISFVFPEVRFLVRDLLADIDRGWFSAFGLVLTTLRFALIFLAACLVALIAPGWVRRIEWNVSTAPMASGFVGLAGELLAIPVFVVLVVALVVTIVGIPLLMLMPFAALGFLIAWIAGFAGVAAQLGGRLRSNPGRAMPRSAVGDVAAGVMLLFAVTFAGKLLAFMMPPLSGPFALAGFVIEYLAWTVGLGAALVAPLRRRWPVAPPPIPSATHSTSHGFGQASA